MWDRARRSRVEHQLTHPIPSERSPTMTVLRKLLIVVPAALGLVAVATGPASAGIVLGNHCLPVALDPTTTPRSPR